MTVSFSGESDGGGGCLKQGQKPKGLRVGHGIVGKEGSQPICPLARESGEAV